MYPHKQASNVMLFCFFLLSLWIYNSLLKCPCLVTQVTHIGKPLPLLEVKLYFLFDAVWWWQTGQWQGDSDFLSQEVRCSDLQWLLLIFILTSTSRGYFVFPNLTFIRKEGWHFPYTYFKHQNMKEAHGPQQVFKSVWTSQRNKRPLFRLSTVDLKPRERNLGVRDGCAILLQSAEDIKASESQKGCLPSCQDGTSYRARTKKRGLRPQWIDTVPTDFLSQSVVWISWKWQVQLCVLWIVPGVHP